MTESPPISVNSAVKGPASLPYIRAIDGLRAVAVLSVIAFHLNNHLLPGGYAGVDIFFVISGFVVTGSISSRRFTSFPDLLLQFYARRIFRIMPALLVMLLVTLIFSAMFIPDAWLSQSIYAVGKTALVGFSNVTLALQTDDYFSPRAAFNPFLHTWSLGVEEQFYFVFPFIMYLRSRHLAAGKNDSTIIAIVAVLTAVSVVACAILSYVEWRYAFYLIPARFWELGAGMLLCLTIASWRPRIAGLSHAMARGLAAFGAACIVLSFLIPESSSFPFPLAMLPVLGTLVLVALVTARPAGAISAVLSTRAAVGLGLISYSLYLWHWPVLVLFRWTVGLQSVANAGLALVLTFVLAVGSYYFVERPTRLTAGNRLGRIGGGWATAAGVALVFAGALGYRTVLHNKQTLALSVTADKAAWYPDGDHPLAPGARCELGQRRDSVAGGAVTTWLPRRCTKALGAGGTGRLFVIGDSHSLAFSPMLRRYAASEGVEVRSFFASGCPFVSLRSPQRTHPACAQYWAAALTTLRRDMRPGDTLFLPSMRLPRFGDQDGGSAGPVDIHDPDVARDRAIALAEARTILDTLLPTGVSVVLEAPLPVFRAAAFRCSDWFNRGNPACAAGLTMPANELQQLRAPILAHMQTLATRSHAVSIWDPFPVLCPSARCAATKDGRPLFFDGDHISGHANDLLFPSFARHLKMLRRDLSSKVSERASALEQARL